MVEGEKRRFWIPEALAYKGQREPKGMLVFDVELISILGQRRPTSKPRRADAKNTASGLAYKVLKPGNGRRHPERRSTVTVHYSGWTTDGKMFDSSVRAGQPISFRLNGVIKGWTEGVQLMVGGEKTRFWIPETLAYKGQAGRRTACWCSTSSCSSSSNTCAVRRPSRVSGPHNRASAPHFRLGRVLDWTRPSPHGPVRTPFRVRGG